MTIYGAVEGGGTKFNCLVATDKDHILAETRIPTTRPEETMKAVVDFFAKFEEEHDQKIASIGVACFGPVDLNQQSPTYGCITTTPKPDWAKAPILAPLKERFDVPMDFEVDVNGAAIGEHTWGAAQGLTDFVYYTIGTGIGGGAMVGGKMLHGLMHAEMGHQYMPQVEGDDYPGYCPFHGHCFEGVATGPSLADHWGKPAQEFGIDHPAWELEAEYIAIAMSNTVCMLSPQRIILGGGVMNQLHLFPMIREKTINRLAGYIQRPEILEGIDNFIVPPGLGNYAGMMGALAMAMKAAVG
ncbi:MAG: ROK family protein [Anaerolineae bacterium]|jgi:fructokinase|nr:ROK family protein [Anaerolineae bacterium]